ncbi:MAG: glutamate formimidoyltransferase [Anaerolineaceae bacterium]
MKIIECIPNFSDARRPEVVEAIINSVAQVPNVHVLDRHSDMDHNRTVLTFIGDPAGVEEAAYQGIAKAVELIDLNHHQGEHPRLGAADVVPFVPISDLTMQECVEIARRLSKRVADNLGLPVYLYEEASARPDRVNLEDIRRGEYEGIKETIATDPYREPDFGPKVMGPAGAVVIGARQPLIAYNIYLNTPDVSVAEKIARRVRNSSGGFHFVKGMGVLVNGLAQVSMNLTNYQRSPMAQVTEFVRREAQRYGVGIHHSEIVGLVPNRAIINAGRYYLQLDGFEHEQLLENRLFSQQDNQAGGSQVSFLDRVAEGTTAPGGGSAAAYAGALGSALAVMVARLTTGKAKYKEVEEECWQAIEKGENLRKQLTEAIELDAKSFEGIIVARRLPRDTEESIRIRDQAIMEASFNAAVVPFHSAEMCLEVMKLALRMAQIGNINAISDAASGVYQARAGLEAAFLNVEINLIGYETESSAIKLLENARELKRESESIVDELRTLLKERSGL